MTTQLIATNQNKLSIWDREDSINEIRKIFAPDLSNIEFSYLIELGKATKLNPFLKEIWAIKYKDRPAQVFIGRDGYRKSAQSHIDYDYHYTECIFSNDEFEVCNGEISHRYKAVNRGELLGAYCIVKRKNSSRQIYVKVDLKEYDTKLSVWATKKQTMIQKVAEAQALRMAFQELFANTYSEYEAFDNNKKMNATDKINNLMKKGNNNEDNHGKDKVSYIENDEKDKVSYIEMDSIHEPEDDTFEDVSSNDNEKIKGIGISESRTDIENNAIAITEESLDEVTCLMHEKEISSERTKKILDYYKVGCLDELTENQAQHLIIKLNSI